MRTFYDLDCEDPPFEPEPGEIAGVDLTIRLMRAGGQIKIMPGNRELDDVPNTIRVNDTVYTLEHVEWISEDPIFIWYSAQYA